MAKKQLAISISYIEQNGLTSGYTSIVYRTPDEDLGFWYSNLKSALAELEKVTPETSQLERSNLLLKLRETLLDKTREKEQVTAPSGVEIFPSNSFFAFWGILSSIIAVIAVLMFLRD